MNLNLNRRRDAKVKSYLDSIRCMGLTQIIREPTHENTRGDATAILDHFITSEPTLYEQSGVIIVSATAHMPIFASRKKFKEEHPKEKTYSRAYSRLKPDDFCADVDTTDWAFVFEEPDPDKAWSLFKDRFITILDKHAPYKLFNTRIARNRIVTLKREFERHFFRNFISEAKGDSSKLWKVPKRFIKNTDTREKY